MTADILTKSLPPDKHNQCMMHLGMCPIPKIHALMVSTSPLCGSSNFHSCLPFLEPFLHKLALAITIACPFDPSWSRRSRPHIGQMSKTSQKHDFSTHTTRKNHPQACTYCANYGYKHRLCTRPGKRMMFRQQIVQKTNNHG